MRLTARPEPSNRMPVGLAFRPDRLARNSLVVIVRMSPLNPIVIMLYAEFGVFLAGVTCLIVARMVERNGTRAHTTDDASPGARRGLVLSRLGT